MKLETNVKHPSELRYKTLGDYFFDKGGQLIFDIANTGNDVYNKIILIHEFVEFMLVTANGTSIETIDRFDFSHPDSPEPGLESDCPYRREHLVCETIERLLAVHFGLDWKTYEEVCAAVSFDKPKPKTSKSKK
jgi:hypothetical protein